VRDDLKSYVGGYKSPGGHALAHYSSVRIPLTKGTEIKQGEEKIGINTKFVIKKNKLSAPFRSYIIPIIFGKGVDFYTDAVSFCETLGIVKKNGAFYKFEDVTLGQGRNAAAQYLKEHTETLDKIKAQLYTVLSKQTKVIIDEEEVSDEPTE
jgi:recombination protein RecA